MSLLDTLYGHLTPFLDSDGRDMRFVRLLPNEQLLCWHIRHSNLTDGETTCLMLKPYQVSPVVLKTLNVWDKLQDHTRQTVEKVFAALNSKTVVADDGTMETKVVRHREAHTDLPREIECNKCGNKQYIAPSILIQKVCLDGLTGTERQDKLDKWLGTYQCAKCSPKHRGRQANPLYANIPRSITCTKCGKECLQNAKALYTATGGDKDKLKALVEKHLCKKCNPNFGSWLKGKGRRGRQPNPENVGIPKKATCTVCGKEVAIVADNIKKKAKALKLTVDELIKTYKCRGCGGVVRTKKRGKAKV